MSFLDSREQLSPQGIGKSVPRREDARLLMGRGRYANDFSLPGQAYAYILRSPHAHARIAGIDVAAAVDAPGVLAVLTGRDAAADSLRPIPHSPVPSNPHEVPLQSRDGSLFFAAPHPALAIDAVRCVGEPVAVVVAETLAQAMDAAERVDVSYEVLPAVARSRDCGFRRYLSGARKAEWVVYAKAPFAGPEQVLAYVARYTHRVAISNDRLIGIADGDVVVDVDPRHEPLADNKRRRR
jgi:xanthine dehydrogenase molybdopterin-binding subunit B